MQFSTPIIWGTLADRMDNGVLNMAKCAFQGAGLLLALSLPGLVPLYAEFFIYGIGMGGTAVLAETIWADFFVFRGEFQYAISGKIRFIFPSSRNREW